MSQERRTYYLPPEALGLTEEQAQLQETINEVLTSKSSGKNQWEHFTPEFIGTKTQTLDLGSTLRIIYSSQARFQEARISQPEGRVKFDTELPVSIFFVGDVHFGSIYTDHKRFLREMKEISETPNAYVIWMANLIDNGIPAQFPNNMLVNTIPPDKQVIAMRKIIEGLDQDGKILGAVTSPCHEGWTYRVAGQDVNAMLFGFEGRQFPVLENGGRLTFQFPKTKYLVALYHRIGPFRSNFNPCHGLRQMNRLKLNMEADVIVGAHYHVADVEMGYEGTGKHRKTVAYIQSGTYKGIGEIHDLWAKERYGTTGQPSCQSVILWPDKRRIGAFLDFETGMLAHEAHLLHEIAKRESNNT